MRPSVNAFSYAALKRGSESRFVDVITGTTLLKLSIA